MMEEEEDLPDGVSDGDHLQVAVEEESVVLDAQRIFLLMRKEYRLSRNTRALWYFSHLNSEIRVTNKQSMSEFTSSGDLDIVSVEPCDPPGDWDWDTGHLYTYQVTPSSMVTFLSQQYRFVFMIDFSPSAACSDTNIKSGAVLLDQQIKVLRRSLEGVIRPFYVPGSQVLFRPDIYVTVIAWTPFLCTGAQSVLHQGWLLTPHNLDAFMKTVVTGLQELEDHVSRIAAFVIDELETIKIQSERIVGALFEESVPLVPSIPMAAPDTGFVNMIQTGMLALQLLPENSCGGLMVITDGVLNIPDINTLDTLLNHLRTKTISLSFIQVSSSYHPHTGLGYCPNIELMQFMSLSTSGSYLPRCPSVDPSEPYLYEMNIYHEAFLAWSFRKCLEGVKLSKPIIASDKDLFRKGRYTEINNPYFEAASEEKLIEKKRLEMTVNTNLTSILSCRLREGYTVNTVTHKEEMKVRLTLPWKHQTFIHYTVWSPWPEKNKCRVEVAIEGPYEILYDIICQKEKQFSSHFRTAVVKKFYNTIAHLQQTDTLLVALHSFTSNQYNFTIPDPIRNGLPLFVINPGCSVPTLYSSDFSHPIFTNFWKPVSSLDINIWHRWMHTHRIGFLLQHDHPLPKYLLTTSSNGRYHPVQCRKAHFKVYEVIKRWADFCLLENHSYVKFIREDSDHPPTSFYVIRVTSKPPCVVVWLAFLAGIPGNVRHQICRELQDKLLELTITQKVCWRDLPVRRIKQLESSSESEEETSADSGSVKQIPNSQFSEVFACVPMSKPVEKILIRYERVPEDFCSLLGFFPNRPDSPPALRNNESLQRNKSRNASAAFLTLSRYVSHQRWIWTIQNCQNVSMSSQAIARILNTLCKIRIHEGFTFAHSANGIQNMVLEVKMEQEEISEEERENKSQDEGPSCVLQYIIFPPHTNSCSLEEQSDDEQETNSDSINEATEADSEVQIITEIWTEPQDGTVVNNPDLECNFLSGLQQKKIASQFFPRDLECVSTLITFEHLSLMCQNPCVPSPPGSTLQTDHPRCQTQQILNPCKENSSLNNSKEKPLSSNNNIRQIPFAFDLISLLPKSHQTELLFSFFIQDLSPSLSSSYDWFPDQDHISDKPNEMLFDQLLAEFERINDREVELSGRDHRMIPEIIRNRQNPAFRFPSQSSPMKGSSASHNQSASSAHYRPQGFSFSRRNYSGNSMASSSNETRESFNLCLDYPEVENSQARWKCFVKAVSPTHLVLTILPASFKDLKSLILTEENVQMKDSHFVTITEKPMMSDDNTDEEASSDSVSNFDILIGEVSNCQQSEAPNSFSETPGRRQRSGSDVFEMTRPKLPTLRKTSGDASVMRDRTSSLDNTSHSRPVLKNLSQMRGETGADRNRCRSMDSKQDCEPAKCSTPNDQSRLRGGGRTAGRCATDPLHLGAVPAGPWPHLHPPPVYGSIALPIYLFDCNIAGLTSSLLYKDKMDKPKNFYQNHLFKTETASSRSQPKLLEVKKNETDSPGTSGPSPTWEHHEMTGHIDKEIKQRCHIIQMTFFKAYVQVLFRSLQLGWNIHTFDVQHCVDYCDNEGSLDLDLEGFIKAVCVHKDMTTVSKAEDTVTRDMDIQDVCKKNVIVVDTDKIRSSKSCVNLDSFHRDTQRKFMDILKKQFKQVPSHPDLFFFCPPGLDIGALHNSSSRKRNETRSSEGTSKNFHSVSSGKIKTDEDEDRTIEFRSEMSEGSVKLKGGESMTDAETNVRDGQSNMSVLSNLETDDMDDDDDDDIEEPDEFSPPLFIQFSLDITQDKEDIVCAPVKGLPTCLAEIFQDASIPDPEQELALELLGLKLDLVCMTLPKQLESLTENFASLRSTSLCSSASYNRDSTSLTDDDPPEETSIEEDLQSGSDVLAHLPTYQHWAVINVLDEMKWMLRDEIAFALTKTLPISQQTLEFVRNHVQSSVGKSSCNVETVDLNFVFGTQLSLDKFKENFLKMEVAGFILREVGDFYYLDLKPCESIEADIESRGRDDNANVSRRKIHRHSRHQQLSPVKEASVSVLTDGNQSQPPLSSNLEQTENCEEFLGLDDEISRLSERADITSNMSCIFQVDKERVNMFLHYRDDNPHIKSTWKSVHQELLAAIKNMCVHVNQCLLLNDLYDRRHCNRLLEQERTDDIFKDPTHNDQEEEDESPYLEANLNMKFSPGQFKCPEVWETKFYLHPRLKQGQGHNPHSRGLNAMKSILYCYMVTNRSNMFVFKDDTKNVYYMKIAESIQTGGYSRQNSLIQPPLEDQIWSRSSSVSKSRKESSEEGTPFSRSNSIGETDKKTSTEDYIILKVFGVTPASANIKEYLVGYLQKKLDDKVVEVISLMLQRNSRCKLSTDDVLFLQKPNTSPDKVLQFTVNINTIHYLQAVAYYLRQNLVQLPLIAPNYMANCKRFGDFNHEETETDGGQRQVETDVFLYNDYNQKGGHNGIACIALSIVDGKGNLVKHFSYPRPVPSDSHQFTASLSSLEEMIKTEVFDQSRTEDRSPGPMALIQFKLWESGRLDCEKLSNLLHSSIKQAMWDAILEYRMLSAPLSIRTDTEDLGDISLQVPDKNDREKEKQFLPQAETPGETKKEGTLPEIVIDANQLVEDSSNPVLDCYEVGRLGVLHSMYSHNVFNWMELGLGIDSPSVYKHSVDLVATNSLPLVLKEIESQISAIIPDLETKFFQKTKDEKELTTFLPYNKNSKLVSEEFILISRNFKHWKIGNREDFVDPSVFITRAVKGSQNFQPLILEPALSEDSSNSPGVEGLTTGLTGLTAGLTSLPLTPTTPAPATVGLSGMLQTIQTTSQVFVPRQRLVSAKVTRKNITFYFYNISKDCQDRLVKHSSNLGQWFTARTSLMSSIVTQKLGLFHNQHFFRAESKCNNPFIGNETYIESLVKNHAPPQGPQQQALLSSKEPHGSIFRDVYKNASPFDPLQKMQFPAETDSLGKHGRQMVNIASGVQREFHRKLFILWQSRGENCNSVYDENLIIYFKSKARLLHYVFTPMLFLPKWRWQANATRDHAAAEFPFEEAKRNSAAQLLENPRLRHGSGSSVKVDRRSGTAISPFVNKSPTESPKPLRVNQNERFHADLLGHFFQEYIQYLQTLGFMLIDLKANSKKSKGSQEDSGVRRRHTTGRNKIENKTMYLQKSLLGGILIFEIGISEPFFYTKLHALEASRIQLKTNQQLTGKNFASSFIDECDRIKVLIHLHSFTYDYHLRTIQSHIAQKHTNLRSGFHIVSFLEDFMKYYSKGPNFARNLVHSGAIEIKTKAVSPLSLFNFLLSHEKQYGMSFIRMEPVIIDPSTEMDNEYVLIKINQHRVSFKDHQDARRTDDFDVSLILSYDSCNIGKPDKQKELLRMKYFVVMTSKRQLYPMYAVEKKLGKFRTVSTSHTLKFLQKIVTPKYPPSRPGGTPENGPALPGSVRVFPLMEELSTASTRENTPDQELEGTSMKSHILGKLSGIRRESVNYVGYYSQHEETMKTVIQNQAQSGEDKVKEIFEGAMVDCRRDQLWQKLLFDRGSGSATVPNLSHLEFLELISLVHHETLDKFDPRLAPLLQKKPEWYLSLAKVLQNKYGEFSRQFSSEDGQVHHTVVIHQENLALFALLSVDSVEGSLAIVHRDLQPNSKQKEEMAQSLQALLEGFVEACAFHAWSLLL